MDLREILLAFAIWVSALAGLLLIVIALLGAGFGGGFGGSPTVLTCSGLACWFGCGSLIMLGRRRSRGP